MESLEYSSDGLILKRKELEGIVFVNYWINTYMGDFYDLNTDYYVVKGGEVYLINNEGELRKSNDTLLSLETECTKIGKYNDADNPYKRNSRSIKPKQLHKFFNKPTISKN